MNKLKFYLFIGLLGLWVPVTFGQTSGKVYYASILEIQDFKKVPSVTVFRDYQSSFHFLNKMENSDANKENSISYKDPFNLKMRITLGAPWASYQEIFIDRNKEEIISRENYFKDGKSHACVTVEPASPMDWEITGEKKTIDAFEAIKAYTEFRGRSYTAWFTTDIPIDIGPWKFHGLPGLILEVYDDEKGVQFYMREIQIPVELKKEIAPPSAPERLTIQEYASLEQNFPKEFVELIKSKLPRSAHISELDVKKNNIGIEREFNFADSKTN